jgi:uncharacterized ferritin-like protein (DUF455 family)
MRVAETVERTKDHIARCVRISNLLALWTITTPEVELKSVFARHLYWAVQSAERLKVRLTELAVDVDPRTVALNTAANDFSACELALSTPEKIRTLYGVALVNLKKSIVDHLDRSGPLADEPTTKILAELLISAARIAEEADAAFRSVCEIFPNLERLSSSNDGHLAPKVPVQPARDSRFTEATANPNLVEIVKLLHVFFTDLELATIESCGRLIIEFPAMPWEFVVDMARQCWDEARHAEAFRTRLVQLGGRLGTYLTSHTLWEMASGEPIEVRLAVQQRVGEWIGVDGAIWQAQQLRFGGDEITSELFEFVALDEITHVAFGNKWIRYLAAGNESKVKLAHDLAIQKRLEYGKSVAGPLTFPYNDWACERGGFTESERDELRSRFIEFGSDFHNSDSDAMRGIADKRLASRG